MRGPRPAFIAGRPYKVLQADAFKKNDVNNKTRGGHLKSARAPRAAAINTTSKGRAADERLASDAAGYSFPSNLTRIRVAFDVVFSAASNDWRGS